MPRSVLPRVYGSSGAEPTTGSLLVRCRTRTLSVLLDSVSMSGYWRYVRSLVAVVEDQEAGRHTVCHRTVKEVSFLRPL
jgi:hypothetical protein